MHHDTTIIWDNAEEFRPEKWIESIEEKVKLMDCRSVTVSGISSPYTFTLTKELVWIWIKDLRWEEYLDHGMGKPVPQLLRHYAFEIEWASD